MPKQHGRITRNVASLFEDIRDPGIPPPFQAEDSESRHEALAAGEQVVELPLEEIQLDPIQVRYIMAVKDLRARSEQGSRWARDQIDELQALGEHMREHGQIQPIRVFRTERGRRYQVLVGHRRVMAAELVELPSVMAVILPEEPDELQKLEYQVGENVHRRNFNDMERARIYERFKGAIGRRGRPSRSDQKQGPALDDATIAARIGVKPDRMAQIFRLTRFARPAQDVIIEEGWPETVLRPLHQALQVLKLDEQAQVAVLHELARRAALRDSALTNVVVADYVRDLQRSEEREAHELGHAWVQAQLRQLVDATRDLVRLRTEFASGREMPAEEREVLRVALENLQHELRQTRIDVFGEPAGNS